MKKYFHNLSGRSLLSSQTNRLSTIYSTLKDWKKIKNNKIQRWSKAKIISQQTLSKGYCGAAINKEKLADLHNRLCHPVITRLAHFIRVRDLPYSFEKVEKVCAECHTCARLKPRFYIPRTSHLIKATQPMERISMDFKGLLPSRNHYLLTIVNEYSRFPFVFPCPNMTAETLS